MVPALASAGIYKASSSLAVRPKRIFRQVSENSQTLITWHKAEFVLQFCGFYHFTVVAFQPRIFIRNY
jgi:hypothetical protein